MDGIFRFPRNQSEFFQKSTFRAFSTLLGAVVSIVLMDDLAQSTLGYDVALALWLGLMTYFASLEQGLGSYGFALMGFTVPILTLGNVEAPLNTFDTAVSRCSEPILGVGCAYVSSVLVAHGTQVIRRDSANAIEAMGQDCAAWDAACHEVSHRGGGVCFRGVPQRDGLGHHDGDFHCADILNLPKISILAQIENLTKYAARASFGELSAESRRQFGHSHLRLAGPRHRRHGAGPVEACRDHVAEFCGTGPYVLIGGGQSNPIYAAFWHTELVRYVDFMDNFLAPTETCHTAKNFGVALTIAD
jgi:hypothetical protein